MTSEPSTSLDPLETERSTLLHEALTEAGKNRLQMQKIQTLGHNLNQGTENQSENQNRDETLSNNQQLYDKLRQHPLLPIVRVLINKCNQASQTLDKSIFAMDDVVKVFKELEENGVDGVTDHAEIDEFMRNEIVELRKSLVELERVHELTNNFKSRYLATLKRTVCQEALVGTNIDSDDDLQEAISASTDDSSSSNLADSTFATLQTLSGTLSIPLHINKQSITVVPNVSVSQLEKSVDFLKNLGYPQRFFKNSTSDEIDNAGSVENSPENSEEEKQLLFDVTQ